MMISTPRRQKTWWGTAAIACLVASSLLAGCGGNETKTTAQGGVELTLWARHAGVDPAKLLAERYNTSHDNQVKVTVIPSDAYQQKVGAAAGSGDLPDLLGADVVYSPNYVKQGIYRDITDKMKGLSFFDQLTPAHSQAASKDGKIYGAPLVVDSSLLIYNKDLYAQAGLDPEAPPADFTEIYEQAKAIRALGGDTYGFYFAGNSAGANAYTLFPYLSAAGEPPLENDGATANINSSAMKATLDLYKKLYEEDIAPTGAKTEDGSTWSASFMAGKIGMMGYLPSPQ